MWHLRRVGQHAAQTIALVGSLAACTPTQVPPVPAEPTPTPVTNTPASGGRSVLAPEVEVYGLRDGGPSFAIVDPSPPRWDELEPPSTSRYATTPVAQAELAGAIRARAAARAAVAASLAKQDSIATRAAWQKLDAEKAKTTAACAKHRATLTDAGLALYALLLIEREERLYYDALDAADGIEPAPPTYGDPAAVVAELLAKFPNSPHAPLAAYLAADIPIRVAVDDTRRDPAISNMLRLARAFGNATLQRHAYARVMDARFQDDRVDKLPEALEAIAWLLANTTDATMLATLNFRRAVILGKQHDPAARTAYCATLAVSTPLDDLATYLLVQDLLRDPSPVIDACAQKTCPCLSKVVAGVTEALIERDDAPRARPIVEAGLAVFPAAAEARTLTCELARMREAAGEPATAQREALATMYGIGGAWAKAHPSAPLAECESGVPVPPSGDDTERARRHVEDLRGFAACYRETAMPMLAMTLEVRIGPDGIATDAKAMTTPFSERETACFVDVLRRHRWIGLERARVVIPLALRGRA